MIIMKLYFIRLLFLICLINGINKSFAFTTSSRLVNPPTATTRLFRLFNVKHEKLYMKINSSRGSLAMTKFTEDQLEKIPPRKLVQLGMQYFKQGDVESSIELFDQAEKIDSSLTPYLWQRGISYYYADRFKEGSDQFRYDVKVNPLDVEEIVWCREVREKFGTF